MNTNNQYNVVQQAREILAMQEEIDYLRTKVDRLEQYEKKYNELLTSSIKHSDTMMSNYLELALGAGYQPLNQHSRSKRYGYSAKVGAE